MTAPTAPADICDHCQKRPVRQWKSGVLGAKNVQLSHCDCDVAFCPHDGCGRTLVDVPMFASRCPKCSGELTVRRSW